MTLVISICTLILLGTAIGVGTYTFFYADGISYLSNKPEACGNCHVMREVLHDWRSGDHHHVAVCNDCHVPQGPVSKWVTKAINGMHHSYAFTFTETPVNIRARALSRQIVQDNCLRCHGHMLPGHNMIRGSVGMSPAPESSTTCISCHRQVGHQH